MVGELGEVQVMDWGLAKDTMSRDREGAGDETNAAPLPDGRGSLEQTADETNAAPLPGGRGSLEQTAAGTVMGTPGYMAPEQARGEPVDARADVFALGSILAAILTGQPAFVGTTVYETIAKAAAADLADVQQRLAACGADAELLAIARRCLAAQPEERYADGREVAAAVAAYRATVEARLRQAETAAAEALVREAEQRKRRRLAVGLGGGIAAVLLVGLAVSLGLMQRAIHAERIAVENEQQALANAEQERLAKVEAEAEKRKAIKFRNQALDALRATTGRDVEKLLGEKKELSANEREYLEAIAGRWQTFARREGTDEASRAVAAEGHFRVAYLWQQLGRREEALPEYEQAVALQEKLAADFPAVPDYRRELAQSHTNLGLLLADLGKRAEAEQQYRQGLALREKLVADFPAVPDYRRELAQSHNNLGVLLAGLGKRAEAEQQYRQGLALREKLVADFPAVPDYRRDLGGSCCNLGNLVWDSGRAGDSLIWFDKAIATLAPVHQAEPRAVTTRLFLRNSHWGRAEAYDQLQKYAEAVQDWDRAIELSPPAEQPRLRANRATSRLKAGQVAKAVAEVEELTKASNWNASQWYDFACVYAVASGKLADKKQEYADRAMELLREAVAKASRTWSA
jgi:tetratricopeptide (TPR) repeat protein